MSDIFDNIILCKDCGKKMSQTNIDKNGFQLRALECKNCRNKIIHPHDLKIYNDFVNLRKKHYKVKLRLVGNSYAVSIPKEIVEFMHEQEKRMKEIVNLCFEEVGRIHDLIDDEVNMVKFHI